MRHKLPSTGVLAIKWVIYVTYIPLLAAGKRVFYEIALSLQQTCDMKYDYLQLFDVRKSQ
jgi:hypothetical protein